MDLNEALNRALAWREEGKCSTAAEVGIALLNEIERLRGEVVAYVGVNERFPGDDDPWAQERSTITKEVVLRAENCLPDGTYLYARKT